ncbi:hypothetical protein BDV95DRAFT_603577 [Massariosphaeria phaeospora]|uniref:Uncharacterized protein n=1 Tax=Massariosphaeria phaeospora TaxID=100035 RepID=A0A7C8MQS1_9PLEO|nr:hypothetical protein BDV95DRAFT_603577 [Massariosphaeria phaeospora]
MRAIRRIIRNLRADEEEYFEDSDEDRETPGNEYRHEESDVGPWIEPPFALADKLVLNIKGALNASKTSSLSVVRDGADRSKPRLRHDWIAAHLRYHIEPDYNSFDDQPVHRRERPTVIALRIILATDANSKPTKDEMLKALVCQLHDQLSEYQRCKHALEEIMMNVEKMDRPLNWIHVLEQLLAVIRVEIPVFVLLYGGDRDEVFEVVHEIQRMGTTKLTSKVHVVMTGPGTNRVATLKRCKVFVADPTDFQMLDGVEDTVEGSSAY